MKKLKYCIELQKGKLPKKFTKNSDFPIYLSMEYLRGDSSDIRYVEDDNVVCADEDDILILWDGSNAGEIILSKKGVISSTTALLKPKNNLHRTFLFYNLKSSEQYFKDMSVGMGIPHVNPHELLNFSFFIPSFQEQTAIASYLDRKTAEIDELIADKKRLLELYEEEKTAIINQAVTKGINPDVKMKDSGIEWLGEIPVHWEVKRLKRIISKAGSGITPRGGAEVYKTSGIPLIRSQNIYNDGLKLEDVAYISEKVHHSMSNSKVLSGDVLLNITGGSIGRAIYIEDWLGEANVNQHVCIIRPLDNVMSRFLYFVLISQIGQEQIQFEQTGSGREGLNFESLKNFIIPFPIQKEQQSIVNYIEVESARIDAKITKAEKLIELLEEYRQALISEVVTGKVRVIESKRLFTRR